ncbi:hypothetical protein HMPREF9123_0849 [Neisseria bacilliformis ATCC BAA-1200]|uniref:Uncharacterized protein n=1 Tax=Neisseria bacilliformis ATCC BAA-1200 TaxID=888742 RepID=F2BAU5_9NEIS|nr:hypothetical protein HMPREF9123_0849 [Neisseria bacilliformis ATCC BAA-1200]
MTFLKKRFSDFQTASAVGQGVWRKPRTRLGVLGNARIGYAAETACVALGDTPCVRFGIEGWEQAV